jgi:hypothetical protein
MSATTDPGTEEFGTLKDAILTPRMLLRCIDNMSRDEVRLLRDLIAGSSNVRSHPADYGPASLLIGVQPKPKEAASAYPMNPTG